MSGMPTRGSPAIGWGTGGSPVRIGTQSANVLPVIFGLSRSFAGCSSVGEQPFCDGTKMMPATGSAAGGPVMLAPPPPPGQMFAGPLPSALPR